jgi:hypothetical protein
MSGRLRNRIIGLVRFSYAALSGFVKAPEDAVALEAMLSDPVRLERRFHLFEALTVPALMAQTDPAFDTIFLTGTGLPAAARARLDAAARKVPGSRVIALPPLHHYPAMQRAFAQVVGEESTHLTSFRLDDDDAIDIDYIARLRRLSDGLLGLCGAERPFTIGCNRGFFLELSPEGNRLYDVVEKLPLGIGLAMTAPVAGSENIFRRNHRLLPQFYTTLTDADTPAFIRTVHADNDSVPHAGGVVGKMTEAAIARTIADRFPFTADGLLAL